MAKKQVASLLFNKDRTDNDSSSAEQQPDLQQPSSEIVINTLDLTTQSSDSSSNTISSTLPDSYLKAIQRTKKILGKGKELFSQLTK